MPFSEDVKLDNCRARTTSKIRSALRFYAKVRLRLNPRERSCYMLCILILEARQKNKQEWSDESLDTMDALNANHRS